MNRTKILDTLRKKVRHAHEDDSDFVFLPVWQAKQLINYLQPMPPKKTIIGWKCSRCDHKLVNASYYQQKHCDECGQLIDWP